VAEPMFGLFVVRTSRLWRLWRCRDFGWFTSVPCRWRSATFWSAADASSAEDHPRLDNYPVSVHSWLRLPSI